MSTYSLKDLIEVAGKGREFSLSDEKAFKAFVYSIFKDPEFAKKT